MDDHEYCSLLALHVYRVICPLLVLKLVQVALRHSKVTRNQLTLIGSVYVCMCVCECVFCVCVYCMCM